MHLLTKILIFIGLIGPAVNAQVTDSLSAEYSSHIPITEVLDSLLAAQGGHITSTKIFDNVMAVHGAQISIDKNADSRPVVLEGKYITSHSFLQLIDPTVVTWPTELSDTMHLYFKTEDHPVLKYFKSQGQIMHKRKLIHSTCFQMISS